MDFLGLLWLQSDLVRLAVCRSVAAVAVSSCISAGAEPCFRIQMEIW